MRVVVLGAGFGGLELASRLSAELGESAEVTLVDRAEGFVFGFSKLDVMFGRATREHVLHRYDALAHPGVRFLRSEVRAIDPGGRRVTTDTGELEADFLVVALGADLEPAATPGLLDGGREFYSVPGAAAAHEELERFDGGRVVVGVISAPLKCPPAPSEAALMAHELLSRRGLLGRSTVSLVSPMPAPVPPAPDASAYLVKTFEQRGIGFHPGRQIRRLDPERRVAIDADGEEIGYDLFLGVPKHVAPPVVVESGLTEDGWIPVDPVTLETRFPGVYAVGDVTSVGTPKAGVFAEGQAATVAAGIVAKVRSGGEPPAYDGRGFCYFEVGGDEVGKVDVTFSSGAATVGRLVEPSAGIAAEKAAFGADRIRRWFGRDWSPR